MPVEQQPRTRDQGLALIETAAKAATAYGRDDLVRRLRLTRERAADPAVFVLVVGEFKQGKSSLVNSLVRSRVCPVDDDVATAVPTLVRYGAEASASLVLAPEDAAMDAEVRSQPIDVADIRRYVTEGGAGAPVPERVEVTLPSPTLESGIVLVDTPGVGGLGSPHAAVTVAALPLADALVFVTDASQAFTAPEADFLQMAREMCPNVVVALTKRDLHPRWREIAEENREILRAFGIEAPVMGVSAPLHAQALESGDAELLAESGIEAMERHIVDELVSRARRRTTRAVAADLISVTAQLEGRFRAEREVLVDPEAGRQLAERFERAKDEADRLRSDASGWQFTLQDGVADLNADVDTGLRGGLRELAREIESAIDDVDPAEVWAEFEPWLRTRAAQFVTGVYTRFHRESVALSARVAEHFQSAQDELDDLVSGHTPRGSFDAVGVERSGADKAWSRMDKGLVAVRSSYGGVLMFGMASGLAGLSAINPASVVVGLLLGRKALKDERKRRLAQSQAQAKTSVRRYLDDLQFQVSADVRGALRVLHRRIRDWYSARAEEDQRSSRETLAGIQEARGKDAAERGSRLRDLEAELERLGALREKVEAYARHGDEAPA